MKYCSKCGAQIPDNTNFCRNCGDQENVDTPEKSRSTGLVIAVIGLAAVAVAAIVFMVIRLAGPSGAAVPQGQAASALNTDGLTEYEEDFDFNSNNDFTDANISDQTQAAPEQEAEEQAPVENTPQPEQEPVQQTAEPATEPPPDVNGYGFLVDDPAFAAGLQPNVLEYLDGTVWYSTGRSVDNPYAFDESINTFSEYDLMYTFYAEEGYVAAYNTVNDVESGDTIDIDGNSDYIDLFYYSETIDGVEYIGNTRLFVVDGVLYDVLIEDGISVSVYSVFEEYFE